MGFRFNPLESCASAWVVAFVLKPVAHWLDENHASNSPFFLFVDEFDPHWRQADQRCAYEKAKRWIPQRVHYLASQAARRDITSSSTSLSAVR